ncbi:hypothetical protein EDD16DRAFT_1524525 [Pisolithus croceorrhizus]|nr:hypothetical protein EDD16DRAFT_1524525 [Pisolithus croceorrhizus]KAI6113290.1 hypothetical protein EV401DRAFT_1890309 [Pisolithus croceorrhizus]
MAGSVGSQESLYKGTKGMGRLDMYSPYRGVTSTARVMKRTWTVGSGASLKAPESTWRGVGSGSAQGRGDLGGNEDDGGDIGRGVGPLFSTFPRRVMPLKQALVINTSSASRAGGVLEARETEVMGKRWRMSGSVMWLGSAKVQS